MKKVLDILNESLYKECIDSNKEISYVSSSFQSLSNSIR